MESLVMLVLLAGGGLFAYRQWKAIQAEAQPRWITSRPMRAEGVERDAPAAYTVIEPEILEPEILPPPGITYRTATSPSKPKMNKWVLFGLALLYVVCPLDGDFIPVIGWIDDAVVMGMAIKALMDKNR